MHGDGGAGNSKVRRQVLERQIWRVGMRELQWRSERRELVVREDEGRLGQRIPEMCR
jgi:hypothetical protein